MLENIGNGLSTGAKLPLLLAFEAIADGFNILPVSVDTWDPANSDTIKRSRCFCFSTSGGGDNRRANMSWLWYLDR